VLTYLEEIQGGEVKSEEESHKLTKSLSAKLAVQGELETGTSSQQEDSIERAVTPTAASAYMELFNDLKQGDKIKRIKWYRYRSLEHLSEGQFVLFRTEAVRSPVYLDPYLAVRQSATLSSLFPTPRHGTASDGRVRSERQAARGFLKQVGHDPRMVFSLKPPPSSAPIRYLLPLRYGHLNGEGSLLKDGGGALSVLGKVVRILPEPHQRHGLSYVDFATRQAWRRPLHQAPGALLCRSDPLCEKKVRGVQGNRTKLDEAIREARKSMETALTEQTQVERRGAVVIPIAIYK
jgi:hypothetical protein